MKKKIKKVKKAKKVQLVEIARSFTMKVNTGNYTSADFFASQKAQCKPEDAEQTSEALYAFVKAEVVKSVNSFKAELEREKNKVVRKVEVKQNARNTAELDAFAGLEESDVHEVND